MNTFKKISVTVAILWAVMYGGDLYAQDFALKTNTLYLATLTPNIGAEFRLGNNMTLNVGGAYRPSNMSYDPDIRMWLVQPEWRYWTCESFNGHFFGVHLHGAQYYARYDGKLYDGSLVGGGISYGYGWPLAKHWNLEAEIGAGYARMCYKESPDIPCSKCAVRKHRNYIGPTKISLTVSYLF